MDEGSGRNGDRLHGRVDGGMQRPRRGNTLRRRHYPRRPRRERRRRTRRHRLPAAVRQRHLAGGLVRAPAGRQLPDSRRDVRGAARTAERSDPSADGHEPARLRHPPPLPGRHGPQRHHELRRVAVVRLQPRRPRHHRRRRPTSAPSLRAPRRPTQVDGNGGIDNSFGENVLPILITVSGSDFSQKVNAEIADGASRISSTSAASTDTAGNTTTASGLSGVLLAGGDYATVNHGRRRPGPSPPTGRSSRRASPAARPVFARRGRIPSPARR